MTNTEIKSRPQSLKVQVVTEPETKHRPTHRLYAVREIGNGKSSWKEIGAAWANQDGKGFNIKFDVLPVGECSIVMREPREEGEAA
jgi:hypothetical protein